MWTIKDWTGKTMFPEKFKSFDTAESFLCEYFTQQGIDYQEYRQEYEIVEI